MAWCRSGRSADAKRPSKATMPEARDSSRRKSPRLWADTEQVNSARHWVSRVAGTSEQLWVNGEDDAGDAGDAETTDGTEKSAAASQSPRHARVRGASRTLRRAFQELWLAFSWRISLSGRTIACETGSWKKTLALEDEEKRRTVGGRSDGVEKKMLVR